MLRDDLGRFSIVEVGTQCGAVSKPPSDDVQAERGGPLRQVIAILRLRPHLKSIERNKIAMARLASKTKSTPKTPEYRSAPIKKKRSAPAAVSDPEPLEAPGYATGDLVSHPLFGDGAVTAIVDDKLTIDFGDRGIKQIVHYYVDHRAA
jgi:hypothetical protein